MSEITLPEGRDNQDFRVREPELFCRLVEAPYFLAVKQAFATLTVKANLASIGIATATGTANLTTAKSGRSLTGTGVTRAFGGASLTVAATLAGSGKSERTTELNAPASVAGSGSSAAVGKGLLLTFDRANLVDVASERVKQFRLLIRAMLDLNELELYDRQGNPTLLPKGAVVKLAEIYEGLGCEHRDGTQTVLSNFADESAGSAASSRGLPNRADDDFAPAIRKRWTPQLLQEMSSYRKEHGTKKAAERYRISEARVRGLLPSAAKPQVFDAFKRLIK